MAQDEYKYSDSTGKIIGCAMKVRSHFGLGFSEIIYKRSLRIELEKNHLPCRSEVDKNIFYRGQFIGKRKLDLIVGDKILIELKAVSEVDKAILIKSSII